MFLIVSYVVGITLGDAGSAIQDLAMIDKVSKTILH